MNSDDHVSGPHKIRSFLIAFTAAGVSLCLVCALLVYIFDPFYHYHAPWLGLKAVLTEKEYQVVGSLRTFEYDTVLVGSSVAENNDNTWYDEAFGGTTIKAVRSYGRIADLVWYLEEAFDAQDVKQVFFSLDSFALIEEAVTTFEDTGCPMYLYDDNPLNDIKYLLNKTVLLERIPYMIAQSLSGSYDESLSYNWADGKDFSASGALSQYARASEVTEMEDPADYAENLAANLQLLTELIEAHPETQFTFFYPPYSMLWWDDAVRAGLSDTYIYAETIAAETLLQYDNVRLFDFQNETDITTNLDNYMDTVHFSPDINYEICISIRDGECEVMADNLEATFARTAELAEEYLAGPIQELEDAGLLQYDS